MTQDPQQPNQNQVQQGWAPWAGRRRMAILAAVGVAASFILIALGGYLLAAGRKGTVVLVFGIVALVFWVIAIPLAKRIGKV